MQRSQRHFRFGKAMGAAALALCLTGVDASAQSLTNTGEVKNSGTIRFNDASSQFTNDVGGTLTNTNGTVEFTEDHASDTYFNGAAELGAAAGSRIGGTVLYSEGAGNQGLQGRFYTNLELSGGTKDIPDATYVFSSYTINGGTGDRTYAGTFHYDGDGGSPQTITAENGTVGTTNRYNNLSLEDAGVKTVSGEVNTAGSLELIASNTGGLVVDGTGILDIGTTTTQDAAAPIAISASGLMELGDDAGDAGTLSGTVTVNGTLNTDGGGAVTVAGNLNVGDDGTFNLNNGDATVGAAGSLTLADFADAALQVDANRTLTVTGTFTNNHAAAVNMTYDPTSTVVYNGGAAQSVVATVVTNQYGNLTAESAGSKELAGNVFMATNLSVSDANLLTDGNTLTMTNSAGTATYGSGIEVVGSMQRLFAGAAGALTFNNEETTIEITSNLASVTDITLDVEPGTNHNGGFDATTDVNRRIGFSFNETASDWQMTMRAGYLTAEDPTDPTAQNTLRFREVTTPPNSEKISTGVPGGLTRDETATPFRFLQLQGVGPGNSFALANVANNSEIFMRGGPTIFNAIATGRWSNPNTWDEGTEPTAADSVQIDGFVVHAGFRRTGTGMDGGLAIGQIAEASPTQLARGIAIIQNGGAPSALIVANNTASGNGDEGQTDWNLDNNGTVTNSSSGVSTGITVASAAELAGVIGADVAELYNGLLVFETNTFGTNSIDNTGGVICNGGVIEVGD